MKGCRRPIKRVVYGYMSGIQGFCKVPAVLALDSTVQNPAPSQGPWCDNSLLLRVHTQRLKCSSVLGTALLPKRK